MAFIDIEYLTNLGYKIPQSSVENVTERLNTLIANKELEYFQQTIGYALTVQLYALVEPYPAEVEIFLNGNYVDGETFYKGILKEIAAFIMANYYGTLEINVNNSGFSRPLADGEKQVSPNFIVTDLINHVLTDRCYTYQWLIENNTDFFATWESDYLTIMEATSLW